MNRRRILSVAGFTLAGIVILGVSLLIAFNLPATPIELPSKASASPKNTDPRVGWVTVEEHWGNRLETTVIKRCDGTTLVYISDGQYSGGVAAIPGSPECTR